MREGQPVSALAPKRPLRLSAKDFEARTPTPGISSPLAIYRVPKNTLVELDTKAPFIFQVTTSFDVNGDSDAAGKLYPEIPSDIYIPDVLFDDDGKRLFVASLKTGSGALTKRKINRVYKNSAGDKNYLEIGGLQASKTYSGKVYVPYSQGQIRIRANMPAATDQRSFELFNSTLRALNETDQTRGDTALTLNQGAQRLAALGAQWELVIEVKADRALEWDPQNGARLDLRAYSQPVKISDPGRLNAGLALRLA